MSQSKFEAITSHRRQARENTREQVTTGFGFGPGWLRDRREVCQPITVCSNKQTRITLDTQLKTALV